MSNETIPQVILKKELSDIILSDSEDFSISKKGPIEKFSKSFSKQGFMGITNKGNLVGYIIDDTFFELNAEKSFLPQNDYDLYLGDENISFTKTINWTDFNADVFRMKKQWVLAVGYIGKKKGVNSVSTRNIDIRYVYVPISSPEKDMIWQFPSNQ